MSLEVLHVRDCPNLLPLLERIAGITDLPVTTRLLESEAAAADLGMAGSPTLLIDGVDPFAAADQHDRGISCRLYRDPDGRIVPVPTVEQLRDAIGAAHAPPAPREVLSAWRTRALPLDPMEKAVHQAILRAFAATGRPPAPRELDTVTASAGRRTTEVLTSLHEIDAIRLGPDGQIAVAYPFSATPTRHRVRLGGQVEVYAMCALDALGMSALTAQDTRIDSVDITTGQPIIVTTCDGRTSWEPATAVVFIGADSGGGPSAECCCDYLNFFGNRDTAHAWASGHPRIPVQILDQAEAEDLAVHLFGNLLPPRGG
ncbi:alkylmercury lyase family protein [Nocardioides sp. 31GB23]|uniref:alkylmercury lyase family protein n=1 Tax=Nocardioides sp. 31GB23 TaxID=3156065 RepID=UPI0032AF39F6